LPNIFLSIPEGKKKEGIVRGDKREDILFLRQRKHHLPSGKEERGGEGKKGRCRKRGGGKKKGGVLGEGLGLRNAPISILF